MPDAMTSPHFQFLQPEWPLLFEAATQVENTAYSDARTACFYARRTLEMAVAWLYTHDPACRLPYQDSLSALLYEPSFRQVVGEALFAKAKLIKDLGNLAVHGARRMAPNDALVAARELFHFCYWLARTYGQRGRPDPALCFVAEHLPKASTAPPQTPDQLQKLETQLRQRDEKLSVLLSEQAALDEELKALRAACAAAKKANAAQPDGHDYSEAETRDIFIDLLLREAGWELDAQKNCEVKITGMPNHQGIGFVDYVLWGDDGKPLALIEAKRTRRDARVGQQQAKLYADCLENRYGQRPVIFYSNGYQHWLWDDASAPPRAVQGFFKKSELEWLVQRRSRRMPLAEATINAEIVGRHYQTRAVRRIAETFETHKQRKALVVMATGAGKTRTVIALADLLMRCHWAKRVLFLADRVALVNQALNAFKKHLPDSSPVNLVTEKNTGGRVFVSTYPTMMGLIEAAFDGQRRFGVGHFDLIIIDEAHRSVYQKYGAIFEYFDALLVGLTATPKDEIDRNTYGLFDLESGVPTDAYALADAVADGFLVPPKAISVPLKFQREGIKYDDLPDEEKAQWDALEWNEEGHTPEAVGAADLNKWLFNSDTVDKALKYLMLHGQKVAGGDRLGKTIVFAKNNDHAKFIAERFEKHYPHGKGHFARVVTYEINYAQTLIDDFSNQEKMPHMVLSVDMLDTGVDVPEVLNLVFFKVVRSKTKFWQMLGRGTRLCPNLFAPGKDKQFFTVFDYCQNLEFFSQDMDAVDGTASESLSCRLFKARLAMLAELDAALIGGSYLAQPAATYSAQRTEMQLRAELATFLQQQVAALNPDNFIVRPQRKSVEKFAQASAWQTLGSDDFAELAQNLARLPTPQVDEDEEAKRFDLLLLRTQLAILQAKPDFAGLRERIQMIASALEDQAEIPAIKAQMLLIQALAGNQWWEGVTVPLLETARQKLRALIKLLEKTKKKIVYTDFADELGDAITIDLPQISSGMDLTKFKEKARQFLKKHESHLSLQRLRRNQPLTPADLGEFELMLAAAGGTKEIIERAKAQSHGLGAFIRSLVGLDRETAKAAFSQFLAGTTSTAQQIEFIDGIIDDLTQNGMMEAKRLYESPFIDLSPHGPDGVFSSAKVDQILGVLAEIRLRAAA